MSSHDTLLSPTTVGGLELNNRVVMAPMTRNQSPENIPTDANVEYYRKRAAGGVGLIVTEGTCVDHIAASGYPGVLISTVTTGWRAGNVLSKRFTPRAGRLRLSFGMWVACASVVCSLRATSMGTPPPA